MSDNTTTLLSKLTILTGRSNFKKWARELLATAMSGGYGSALAGDNALPESIRDSKEIAAISLRDAYRQREEKVMGIIQRSVSDSIAQELFELTVKKYKTQLGINDEEAHPLKDSDFTAHDHFKYLRSRYEKVDAATIIMEWRRFNHFLFVDDGTLERQFDELFELRSRCALHDLKVSDFQFAANILAALPSSFQPLIDSLMAVTDPSELQVDVVRSKVLEQEIRHREHATNNLLRQSGSPFSNPPSSSNNKNNSKKKKGKCHYCGKAGHWIGECRKKKSDKAGNAAAVADPPPPPKPKRGRNSQLNVVEADASSSSPSNNNSVFWYAGADVTPEDWVFDTGATDHMTPYGTDFIPGTYVGGNAARSVILGDQKTRLTILGSGTIERWINVGSSNYQRIQLRNVLLVDGIKRRFISARRLMNIGFEINLKGEHAVINAPDNSYCSVGSSAGPLLIHHLFKKNPSSVRLNAVETLPIGLWHERLGHLDWEAIKRVRRNDSSPLIGVKLDVSEPHGPCDGCLAGKDSRHTFKSKPSNQALHPLELIHADLAGPMETQSITGYFYYFVLIDDGSRLVWVIFLRHKDEAFDHSSPGP